jgi:hypothetical protein
VVSIYAEMWLTNEYLSLHYHTLKQIPCWYKMFKTLSLDKQWAFIDGAGRYVSKCVCIQETCKKNSVVQKLLTINYLHCLNIQDIKIHKNCIINDQFRLKFVNYDLCSQDVKTCKKLNLGWAVLDFLILASIWK